MRLTMTLLLHVLVVCGGAAEKTFRPTGAQSQHDLRYLPEERYSGDPGQRRDDEMLLDLHVPAQGTGPFPVLLTVHGGAWTSGDKQGPLFNQFAQTAIDHGYAVAALNYLRKPKEIVPQVFHDSQDAVRFLRRIAAERRLDPTRIGAVGWSAGGWLVSNLAYVGGDTVLKGHQGAAVTITEFAQGGRRGAKPWIASEVANSTGFVFPAWNPEPAWPEQSGVVQAVSFDFSFWHGLAHPAAAAVNQWAGAGYHEKGESLITRLGLVYDYSYLSDAKAAGKKLHCPPMTSPCTSASGDGTVTLSERILQFFDREFGPTGRAPAPEIRPFLRIVDAPVMVSLFAPPGVDLRFTTDGTDPTPTSPAYTAPITVAPGTTVKALGLAQGRRPSGVAIATFLRGPVPPRITAPAGPRLPEATVGKPYQVAFTAEGGEARWALSGEILPRVLDPRDRTAKPVDVMGLTMDPATGVLAGTPKVGGLWWVQVAVAHGPGQLATTRNYLLPVAGPRGSLGGESGGAEDTHTEIGTLTAWPQTQVDALVSALENAGCAPVVQADGTDVQVLVPADQAAKAQALLTAFAAQQKLAVAPAR